MGGEVGPVEPGYQGQDLLGRPAPPVDHHEVLIDRLRERPLERFLHAVGVQVVGVTRDRHGRQRMSPFSILRNVFSVSSLL